MTAASAWVSLSLLLASAQPPAAQPEKVAASLLTAEPAKDDPKDDDLRKLQKARYNEVLAEVKVRFALYQNARAPFEPFAEAGHRLVRAGLELSDKPADKIALLTQSVELAKTAEAVARARHEAGRTTEADIRQARYWRLDAEIQLLRTKREADTPKGK